MLIGCDDKLYQLGITTGFLLVPFSLHRPIHTTPKTQDRSLMSIRQKRLFVYLFAVHEVGPEIAHTAIIVAFDPVEGTHHILFNLQSQTLMC